MPAEHTDAEKAARPGSAAKPKKRPLRHRLNPLRHAALPPVPDAPEESREGPASWLSKATFSWIQPALVTGYQRPLQENDIWTANPARAAGTQAEKVQARFAHHLSSGSSRPLLRALYDVYRFELTLGGVCAGATYLISPMTSFILRYMIGYLGEAYAAAHNPLLEMPSVGPGVGYIVGIVLMLTVQSMASSHFFYPSAMVGSQARAALTLVIFDKALKLSGRARAGIPLERPPLQPGSDAEKKWLATELKRQKKAAAKKKKEPEVLGWSNGRIVNLMSTDTHRIELGCGQMHVAWASPLSVLLICALLISNLTYSAVAGLGLVFLAVPLLTWGVRQMFARRKGISVITDERVSLTQEIIQAVRFVKRFAWEQSFADRLDAIRKREIRAIQGLLFMRSGINALGMTIPVFAGVLAFVTYSLTGHSMQAGRIFSSLGLFNALRLPMNMLPMVLGQVVDMFAAIGRIEEFLRAEEAAPPVGEPTTPDAAIVLDGASFEWERTHQAAATEPTTTAASKANSAPATTANSGTQTPHEAAAPFGLPDLTVSFKPDELVAVIGSVGSGKTSLLTALAGEMRQTGGTFQIARPRALCPQSAWIENASVRDNILFGAPFDQTAYDLVVEACGLIPDFAQFTDGDSTEVGERGITVSGGQRQRIGIARAAYARVVGVAGTGTGSDAVTNVTPAKVVLMDDPLAAVDAHVGRHIFDEAIVGLLAGSCRILATHQLWVLSKCDRVVWMEDGRIAGFDTVDKLRASHSAFNELLIQYADLEKSSKKENTEDDEEEELVKVQSLKRTGTRERSAETVELAQKLDSNTESDSDFEREEEDPTEKQVEKLMQDEDRASKSIPMSLYIALSRRAGSVLVIPWIIFWLVVSMGTNVFTGVWLAWWTSHKFDNLNDSAYAGVYAAIGVLQTLTLFAFAAIISLFATRASRQLLSAAMRRMLRAPVSFFDTTPVGRITNRFAKDVDTLDNNVSDAVRIFLLTAGMILGTVIMVAVYFPPFLAALGPVFIILVAATMYFRASSREMRRHESVFRSSVFARFGEGVSGIGTIRSFGAQARVSADLQVSIDRVNGATFMLTAAQRWLAIRVDALGTLLVAISGILVVVERKDMDPSIAGLVLSYLLAIAQMIQFSVRQLSEVETSMTAAERVNHYATELPQEPAEEVDGVPASWPEKGAITFDNVKMRYRPKLPLVLRGLSLEIAPGERMAIVGRTGAGKSSILTALFRLVDPVSGQIRIDGRALTDVGLQQLRSRLAIIPQDPVLFRGTVRSNLDPFNAHSDKHLWLALRRAGLTGPFAPADAAATSPSADQAAAGVQLDDAVEEAGSNFSLGQQQLLALARALVRTEARIVVCDEATSSVDMDTDDRVQKTMLACFGGNGDGRGIGSGEDGADDDDGGARSGPRTLLTIAHRLRTVIGYDRVCVMDAGRIAELDSPLALFGIEDGIFRGMCDRSGIGRDQIVAAQAAAAAAGLAAPEPAHVAARGQ